MHVSNLFILFSALIFTSKFLLISHSTKYFLWSFQPTKQDKSLLQTASRRFWETLVTNCIPTLRTYIDDVNSSFSKNSATIGYSNEPPITSLTVTSGTTELSAPKFIHDLDHAINTFLSSNDFLDLKKTSTCTTPSLADSSKTVFELLLQDLTDHQALIDSTNCGVLFPKSLPTFEDIFKIEKTCTVNGVEQLNPFEGTKKLFFPN